MMICNECETVAHCTKHGCVPKRNFWEGYVPEPVKPTQLPFGVGGGLVAIKTLLSRDPCTHAHTAIQMIDAILAERPAQRTWVGLTDEQILKISRDHYDPYLGPEISFARSIEAAHGIKEKTND